jgi:AmmeMemoRadiSam system protein A
VRSASSEPLLAQTEQRRLVELARETVRRGLDGDLGWLPRPHTLTSPLLEQRATFVTLRRQEELLGCIGSIEPRRILAHDVVANARAAAFDDPRLPAVTRTEFTVMSVKVSVLGPMEPLDVSSFTELERSIRAGDGLLISDRRRRATFLPSVWSQVPDAGTFLAMLWQKAGLRPRAWSTAIEIWRYETLEFGD